MKDNKNKLTFFENIYYWFWCCMPKPREKGMDPAIVASFFPQLLKAFNGIFIIFLIQAYLPSKLLNFLFGEYNWLFPIILLGILGFILFIQDNDYDKRIDSISEKILKLSPRQRSVKILIFFFYIIFSVGLLISIPYFNI